jgi:steroid delta-isomerase-like uncharacterized protein
VLYKTPEELVSAFYARIWNEGDFSAISTLLKPDFAFRGSLGNEVVGQDAFSEYVRSVRNALAQYHCEIVECIAEGNCSFAKMRFSGMHVARFRGFEPTGKTVQWMGAALFHCQDGLISKLWVLGDLAGLDAILRLNEHG